MLSKDKKLIPYQVLLFSALGLYLYKAAKRNEALGISDQTKINVDTDKLSRAAMPFIPVPDHYSNAVQSGIKKTLDTVLEKIKK